MQSSNASSNADCARESGRRVVTDAADALVATDSVTVVFDFDDFVAFGTNSKHSQTQEITEN